MTAISTMDLELKRVISVASYHNHIYLNLTNGIGSVALCAVSTQAFTQMQTMKIETTKKLKMIDLQTDVLKTSKKKYEITDNIVVTLTPESRCACSSPSPTQKSHFN